MGRSLDLINVLQEKILWSNCKSFSSSKARVLFSNRQFETNVTLALAKQWVCGMKPPLLKCEDAAGAQLFSVDLVALLYFLGSRLS